MVLPVIVIVHERIYNDNMIYTESVLQTHATQMPDHCPLVLGLKEGILGKKRFHFESSGPNLTGFLKQFSRRGMSGYIIARGGPKTRRAWAPAQAPLSPAQ
jgi:hypothetical protein